jgi:secondary thiamine-phosphate synthase enzyme
MRIVTDKIRVTTKGRNDIIDITDKILAFISKNKFLEGNVLCFVSGSTAGLTTVEYEPGLINDLPEAFERFAPMNKTYHHDNTWHDGNGYAHVRASILGPSLIVPFSKGELLLGTWQQIILIDFDNRSRERNIIVQAMGE